MSGSEEGKSDTSPMSGSEEDKSDTNPMSLDPAIAERLKRESGLNGPAPVVASIAESSVFTDSASASGSTLSIKTAARSPLPTTAPAGLPSRAASTKPSSQKAPAGATPNNPQPSNAKPHGSPK
jgi:hypothetical protein